jgi:hypothetical protein
MGSQQPRRRQERVLRLEATRRGATIGYAILTLAALAASATATWYHDNPGHLPGAVPAAATTIAAVAAAVLALMLLAAVVVNGNRWHLARAVERLSNDPYLTRSRPEQSPPEFLPRARQIPALEVELVRPRKLPRPRRLRRVTATANVTGDRPLSVAYLRLFENQARTHTFMQGAWREFGYVHFLRSAASVTPAEFRHAKSTGNPRGMFLVSREQFLGELAKSPPAPSAKRRHVFRDIAPRAIRVRDRYGSYPPMGHLCHGMIWKLAIDELLRRVDLVVLDLSGFTPRNRGTEYELQRVIDRFPVERVIFLADTSSDREFLRSQILAAWKKMAAGSPNAGAQPRKACLAVTDHYRQPQRAPVMTGAPGQGQVMMQQPAGPPRLEASRRQSRRLVAEAQRRVHQSQPGRGPHPGPPAEAVPGAHRPGEPWWAAAQPSAPAASSAKAARRELAAKLTALVGSVMFLASVALFPNYTNNSPGGPVSLWYATHHDYFSPLHADIFWTAIILLCLIVAFTVMSFAAAGRLFMAGASLAALALAGFTLYIPSIGSDGFSAYGPGYWASLAAAAVMAVGAGLAAVTA